MHRKVQYSLSVIVVLAVLVLAISAPSIVSGVQDAGLIGVTRLEEAGSVSSYRHQMSTIEKINLVTNSSYNPETQTAIKTSFGSASQDNALNMAGQQVQQLISLSVLPAFDFNPQMQLIHSAIITCISTTAPTAYVPVWQLTFQENKTLMTLLMDAETGLIYEFSIMGMAAEVAFPSMTDVLTGWGQYLGLEPLDIKSYVSQTSGVHQPLYTKDGQEIIFSFFYDAKERRLSMQSGQMIAGNLSTDASYQ